MFLVDDVGILQRLGQILLGLDIFVVCVVVGLDDRSCSFCSCHCYELRGFVGGEDATTGFCLTWSFRQMEGVVDKDNVKLLTGGSDDATTEHADIN